MSKHYGHVRGVSHREVQAPPQREKQTEKTNPADYIRTLKKERDKENIRKRLVALIDNPLDKRHGTATGYKYGCRCDRCSQANHDVKSSQYWSQKA